MVLLGDEAQVKTRFSPFGNSANPDARLVHSFASYIPYSQKSFWTHPMELLGDEAQVEYCFDPFRHSVSMSAR